MTHPVKRSGYVWVRCAVDLVKSGVSDSRKAQSESIHHANNHNGPFLWTASVPAAPKELANTELPAPLLKLLHHRQQSRFGSGIFLCKHTIAHNEHTFFHTMATDRRPNNAAAKIMAIDKHQGQRRRSVPRRVPQTIR